MWDSLTQEAGHLLPRFGHVHLQDEVGVGGEAEQSALLSPQLHQLLQDGRVLLKTHAEPIGSAPNSLYWTCDVTMNRLVTHQHQNR